VIVRALDGPAASVAARFPAVLEPVRPRREARRDEVEAAFHGPAAKVPAIGGAIRPNGARRHAFIATAITRSRDRL